jgi:hypothetical protein
MITRFFTLLLFLVSFATVAAAQTPPEVHAKLSLAENKTVYRIGEPIKIVMEFTADHEGYSVEYLVDQNDAVTDYRKLTRRCWSRFVSLRSRQLIATACCCGRKRSCWPVLRPRTFIES